MKHKRISEPKSREDRREIFSLKRQVVNAMVRRVTIDRNRELLVEINLNLHKLLDNDISPETERSNNTRSHIKPAGVLPRRCRFKISDGHVNLQI